MQPDHSNQKTFLFSNFFKAVDYQAKQLEIFRGAFPNTTTTLGIMGRDKYTVNFLLA